MSDSGTGPELAARSGHRAAGRPLEEPKPPPEPPADPDARKPPLRLFLVRHGRSTWNETDRIQGQLDPPLSETGREQAQRLAARLRGMRWEGFYSSDLLRATETAAPIAHECGVAPTLLTDLREIDLGEWEGLTREEVTERYPEQWSRWVTEPTFDAVPGGEGEQRFEQRVLSALELILGNHESGDVLVVTHGGVIQVALGSVLKRSSRGFFPFITDNTAITILRRTRRLVIACVNDTCHLH